MPVVHYFAYGSNMNPARMRARGLLVRSMCAARLPGYALCFDKQSAAHAGTGHANLTRDLSAIAEGVLYELVAEAEILKMDPFENAPINYGREVVEVQTHRGVVPAWTYFANDAVRVADARPEQAYLAHLLAGRPFLSDAWYARLAAWPTVESF